MPGSWYDLGRLRSRVNKTSSSTRKQGEKDERILFNLHMLDSDLQLMPLCISLPTELLISPLRTSGPLGLLPDLLYLAVSAGLVHVFVHEHNNDPGH